MVYLIGFKLCIDQYVGSAYKSNFKPRFILHKSDINTDKDGCFVAKHFSTKCRDVMQLKFILLNKLKKAIIM